MVKSVAYPPRFMGCEEAARYVGLSKTTFLREVKCKNMPKGVQITEKRIVWDRLALDAKADTIAGYASDWDEVFENQS